MNASPDELVAPKFLNNEFLEKVLNNSKNEKNIKVISFETSAPTQKGDHFGSAMFRLTIKISIGNKISETKAILKTLPDVEGQKRDTLDETGIFKTEQSMYANVLPKCCDLLKKAGFNDHIVPRILYYSETPNKTLVFEDLKESGYEMLPGLLPKPSEFNIIISNLAKLHATTFQLASEGKIEVSQYNGNLFNFPTIRQMDFIINGVVELKKSISKLPGLEKYVEKLDKFEPKIFIEKCIKEATTPGPYNVLNHADFHIKNMMFILNKEKIATDMIMCDFQLCYWGSPALDLSYALIMCPKESRSGIIEFYYNTFCEVLRKINFNGKTPTLSDLKSEIKRFQCIELTLFSSILPFMLFDKTKIEEDISDLVENNISNCYHAKVYQDIVKNTLPIFLKEGHLEI